MKKTAVLLMATVMLLGLIPAVFAEEESLSRYSTVILKPAI